MLQFDPGGFSTTASLFWSWPSTAETIAWTTAGGEHRDGPVVDDRGGVGADGRAARG